MADIVRVNTRISKKLNEWLDQRSKETGHSKSTLIMLALENYYQQNEVMDRMQDMTYLMKSIEEIKEQLGK